MNELPTEIWKSTRRLHRERRRKEWGEREGVFSYVNLFCLSVSGSKREREILQNKKFVFHGPWILFKQQNYLFFLMNIKISKFA